MIFKKNEKGLSKKSNKIYYNKIYIIDDIEQNENELNKKVIKFTIIKYTS